MFPANCGINIMTKVLCSSITVPPAFTKKELLVLLFLPLNLKKKSYFQFPICLKRNLM